ncbi:MAG: hypothetical protein IT247_09265 [Bacteroidia bacterium]|nr:hypothetical protein [Bacteroidia bacterium]
MIKLKHVTCLVLMWVTGFLEKAKAQDFLRQSLATVEQELKSEKARYNLIMLTEGSSIVLIEGTDTSVWKFDANNICYEYSLTIDKASYFQLKKHLESVGQMVMKNAYVNRRDNTITYLTFQDNALVVNTKPFDASSSTPPVLMTSAE